MEKISSPMNVCWKGITLTQDERNRKSSYTYGRRKRIARPDIRKAWQSDNANLGHADAPEYWWFHWPRLVQYRRSYYKELFDAECYLIEISEDVLIHVYPNEIDASDAPNPRGQALRLYNRLSEWKLWFMDTIPEEAFDLPQALHISYVSCLCFEREIVECTTENLTDIATKCSSLSCSAKQHT